jgi:carbonic anhydrase
VVLGILVEEGPENAMMNRLPSFRAARGEDPYGDPVDYNRLIPNREDYWAYSGSLTTPPCTEGVYWVVLQQPLVVSPEQIRHYHDLLGFDNNRPIQPTNARLIVD